jgi:hypothetical protein
VLPLVFRKEVPHNYDRSCALSPQVRPPIATDSVASRHRKPARFKGISVVIIPWGEAVKTLVEKLRRQFQREHARRIVKANPGPEAQEFALYVCWARRMRKIERATLAQRAGLQPDFMFFLENELLAPGELTEEVRCRIEAALGVPYRTFLVALERERQQGAIDMADGSMADSALEVAGHAAAPQSNDVTTETCTQLMVLAPPRRVIVQPMIYSFGGDDALMRTDTITTLGSSEKEFATDMTYRIQRWPVI